MWQKDGTWFRIHETLRSEARQKKGRNKHPTAGSMDLQSVKTTSVPSSRGELLEWVKRKFRYCLEVILHSDDIKGFVVLPKRWVLERTFAWLNNHRRLFKDYERFTRSSETMIQIALMRLMLRRLKPL
jgi:transposase